MKVSMIVPILDSQEIFRRQCLHWEKIWIPEDVEILIVDDGSEEPLTYAGPLPIRIIYTNDKRPWTSSLARNIAARQARGEYLIMYDVDHIISKDLLEFTRNFQGQKIHFKREFAVLLEDGTLTQDLETLKDWGFPMERYPTRGLAITPHPNMFAMRKDIFWQLGGYREDLVNRPYPQGEDSAFKNRWHHWVESGKGKRDPYRPIIYMIPQGKLSAGGDVDADPKGLFHKLTRKTKNNVFYQRQKGAENGNVHRAF